MHQAARNAGISPVDMITEPEAAALYTLQSMKEKGLNVSFMICLYCELQPLTIPRMVMLLSSAMLVGVQLI